MAELSLHERGAFRCWAVAGADGEAIRLLESEPEALRAILAAPARPGHASDGRAEATLLALASGPGRMRLRPVRHGGWLAPLWRGRLASPRRPLRELALTAALHARGLPVPRPLLVLAARGAPLWRAAFASEQIEGSVDGRAALSDSVGALREHLAGRVGVALRQIHDSGVRHADPHIGNFLLRASDRGVWVVDLDGSSLAEPPVARERDRQLERLRRSLRKHALEDAIPAVESGYADA